MSKFKAGDIVITLVPYFELPKGSELTIIDYCPKNNTTVEHYKCSNSDEDFEYAYYPHELKLSQAYLNEQKLKKVLGL